VYVCVKDYYVLVQNKYIKEAIFRKKGYILQVQKTFTKLTMSARAPSLLCPYKQIEDQLTTSDVSE
ncbi:hypothetical protein DKP78_20670, partial [Enterococcus faecium]